MIRVTWVAILATLGLSVPFLVLGILGAAWLTQNLTQLATTIATAAALDWGRLALEGWSRWPEVLGMIIGQAPRSRPTARRTSTRRILQLGPVRRPKTPRR
jgi:hypothetical protein